MPTVPYWFRKIMKEYDSTLSARFNNTTHLWDILQPQKFVKNYGRYQDISISRIETKLIPVLSISSLGSAVFKDLDERHNSRFHSYEDFCKKMKVRYE